MIDAERNIRKHLNKSAGTANAPTDYRIEHFIEMIQQGEASIDLFQRIGGDWLTNRILKHAKEIGSVI